MLLKQQLIHNIAHSKLIKKLYSNHLFNLIVWIYVYLIIF